MLSYSDKKPLIMLLLAGSFCAIRQAQYVCAKETISEEKNRIQPVALFKPIDKTSSSSAAAAEKEAVIVEEPSKAFDKPSLPPIEQILEGINISHHQGAIDFQQLCKDDSISFIILKATAGGSHKDSRFLDYCAAIGETGGFKTVGAFHYVQFLRSSPTAQMANFLTQIRAAEQRLGKKLDIVALAVDEMATKGCDLKEHPEKVANVVLQCVHILQSIGITPHIYTNPSFSKKYLDKSEAAKEIADKCNLWIQKWDEALPTQDDFPHCWQQKGWALWQYSKKGYVPGISAKVLLNRMRIFTKNA